MGAGQHLKGFGLASLYGARHGYMPPWLKTKHKIKDEYFPSSLFIQAFLFIREVKVACWLCFNVLHKCGHAKLQ